MMSLSGVQFKPRTLHVLILHVDLRSWWLVVANSLPIHLHVRCEVSFFRQHGQSGTTSRYVEGGLDSM